MSRSASGWDWASRLGRVAVGLVFLATTLALVGGIIEATGWLAEPTSSQPATGEECPDPPCLPASLPPLSSLPAALPLMVLGLAVLIGGLTMLVGLLVLRRGLRPLTTGLLVFVGPLLILVGTEIVPHIANPCYIGEVPVVCADVPEHGLDFADRFHALGHAFVGALPLTAAYWWVLRRWRPEALPALVDRQ